MRTRTLGRTGIQVSEIGFGAWGIGADMWKGARDDESLKALHRAAELGITFYDTALIYGTGHSEKLVGTFLAEHKGKVTVATKIPPKNMRWPARKGTPLKEAFPPDYIVWCTEKSLKNMNIERIDVQQFHVWSDEWAEMDEWKNAIEKLKRDGKARHFGISINDHEPENVLKTLEGGLIDTVQVIYNIFDQSPEDKLFPYCIENEIGVIVRVPLDEGGLTGTVKLDTVFPEGDFRNRYFRGERRREVIERVLQLEKIMKNEASDVAELALRFTLSHPAVSTVIPGMRSVRNVERNCAVSDGRLLSPALREELKNHRWIRNFY